MSGAVRTESVVAVTADHIAVSIVAACQRLEVDPAEAFTGGRNCRKARVMAAAGCMARLGWSRLPTARLFQLDPVKLAPSSLSALKIDVEDLLDVAEALAAHGLTGSDDEPSRFRSPWKAEPKAKADRPVAKVRAPPRVAAPPAATSPEAARPGMRQPSAPRRIAVVPELARPLRARSSAAVRPITAQGLIYIRRFLDSGAWRIEEVADLFDTVPDAIADAIAGPMGVAA